MRKNSFKKDLPPLPPHECFHVYIINRKSSGFCRPIWKCTCEFFIKLKLHSRGGLCNFSFWKNSLMQINSKLTELETVWLHISMRRGLCFFLLYRDNVSRLLNCKVNAPFNIMQREHFIVIKSGSKYKFMFLCHLKNGYSSPTSITHPVFYIYEVLIWLIFSGQSLNENFHTIKMIGHQDRLRDFMGQSYPIYACTPANQASTVKTRE